MKKTTILALALVLVLVLSVALVACSSTNDNKSPQMTIGKNGNWLVDGVDTGISADGSDGKFPYIDEDGNLWIGDEKTDFNVKESVHIHQFDYNISYDNGECLLVATCECKEKIKETISESKDLKYVISEDYTYYTLTGIGNFKGDYVRIPASINEIPVKEIAEGAFHDTEIKGLIVEGNVETIPSNTFNIPTLEFLVINSNLESIEAGSFAGCEKLSYVSLPDTIKHIAEDSFVGTRLFEDESKRENGALYINNYLINVSDTVVGELAVKEGTKLLADGAFNDCTTLRKVILPATITEISQKAFFNCSSLIDVVMNGAVTEIKDGAFFNCRSLYATNFIPSTVRKIGEYAFAYCDSLTSISIPKPVFAIGNYAFLNCERLSAITFASNSELMSIGDYAFANTALKSIVIPDSANKIGFAILSGCSRLTSLTTHFVDYTIETEDSGTVWCQYPLGYYFGTTSCYDCCLATSQLYLDENGEMARATFYIPHSLTSVTVRGDSMPYGAFENCVDIEQVSITGGICDISNYAFNGCVNLKSVSLREGITSIGDNAFQGCTGLINISIPETVTTIGEYAFYGCTNLTKVVFSNSENSQLEQTGDYAFACCYKLETIDIPDNVGMQIGTGIFDGCSVLSWTITFDANGGDCPTETMEVQSGNYVYWPTATRVGYEFDGWLDNAGNLVTSGRWYGVRNCTFTAKWTAKIVNVTLMDVSAVNDAYTVSFDLNGAEGTAPQAQTVTATIGLEYPEVPERDGYAFSGWYTNSACTGDLYDFSAEVTGNITLYAKWVEMTTTTHTREYFDVMNYTSSSSKKSVTASSYSDYNYYYFTCYTAGTYTIYASHTQGDFYFQVNNVTTETLIEKYNLYSSQSSCTITFTANAGDVIRIGTTRYSSSYNATSNGTFYVTGASYPAAGGKANENVFETAQLTYDQDFNLVVPTKDGYTFLGWYDGVDGTGTQYTDANGVGIKTWDKEENTALYAKWEQIA